MWATFFCRNGNAHIRNHSWQQARVDIAGDGEFQIIGLRRLVGIGRKGPEYERCRVARHGWETRHDVEGAGCRSRNGRKILRQRYHD